MCLFQVVFFSQNRMGLSDGSYRALVKDILQSCTGYDRSSGLTGALVFSARFFFQGMEGPRGAVCEQLWKLAADARHADMTLVSAAAIDRRYFEGWMVGYAGHSPELDALYTRYGSGPTLDPSAMTATGSIEFLRAFSHLDDGQFVQRARVGETVAGRTKASAAA